MKHIKTRIKHGTKAGAAAKRIGGFSIAELQRALAGDEAALQKLGEARREGEMTSVLMPAIIETIKSKVKNEKDWNLFIADYVKEGSEAATAIDKANRQTRLATVSYGNKQRENAEQFRGAWELEKGRHKFAIDYNRAKIFADLVFQQVDGEVAILDQKSRLKLRQINEDRKHLIKSSQHYLEYGEEANLELIQKKDYAQTDGLLQRLGRGARNLIGI
jgi:hypothetical protein